MNARQREYLRHALAVYDADEVDDDDAADVAMDLLDLAARALLTGERAAPEATLRAFYAGDLSRHDVNAMVTP